MSHLGADFFHRFLWLSSLPYVVVAHLFWLSIFSWWDYIIMYPFTPLLMTFRLFPCFCCCKHSCTCGRVSLGQARNCCHNFRQCLNVFQGSYTYPHSLTVGPWDEFNDFFVKIQHVRNCHLILWLERFVMEWLFSFLQLLFILVYFICCQCSYPGFLLISTFAW